MEPDQTPNEVEAAIQVETVEPAASIEAADIAEASADPGGAPAPIGAAEPPQIDPVVATEAATPEPQQPSEQEPPTR